MFSHYPLDATSAVTNLSAMWTGGSFSTLQVNWDPVTTVKGVKFRVIYSYISIATKEIVAPVESGHFMLETTSSDIILNDLDPNSFYSVSVSYESTGSGALPNMLGNYCYNVLQYYTTTKISLLKA